MYAIERRVNDEDEFNLKKILSRFIDHWKLYIICTVIFISLGFLFLRYATPMYKSSAQLIIQDQQSNNSSSSFLSSQINNDFSGLFSVKNNLSNEVGILQTRDLLREVVQAMNLNISYFEEGTVRSKELYNKSPFAAEFIPKNDSIKTTTFRVVFPEKGNGEYFFITNIDSANTLKVKFGQTITTSKYSFSLQRTSYPFGDEPYLLTYSPTNAVISGIIQNYTVDISNPQATIIELTYNTDVPAKGKDFLQNLINQYINRNLNEKNRISDSALGFINARIAIVAQDLNNIESNIQTFKQANKIANLSAQSQSLIDNSQDYYIKLNEVEVQLNVAKSTLSYLKDEKNNNRPVPSLLNNDPTFLQLVNQYNSFLVQRDQMLLSVKEINPLLKTIDLQIRNTRNDMVKSLQSQINALQISRDKIVGENASLTSMIKDVPVQERQYIDLSREESIKQSLYLYLLQKKEETAITKASNISSANVIESPKVANAPYFPNQTLVFALCIFLGLALPTGIIVLKHLLSTRIENRDDITHATNCAIVGEINRTNQINLSSLEKEGRSILAEQFRALRTNLEFVIGQKMGARILITSSMSGEGKSFITLNLAKLYGHSGKKVLVMEMDLRKPKISAMLNLANNKGFTNFIIEEGDNILNYIQKITGFQNLYLLSSGPVPPNPAELVMKDAVTKMFEELKRNFDIIIIDTSPVGLVADAQILSKHADINLYIVREKYTFKNSLELVNDIIDNKKFSNFYIVINDVRRGASHRYGYGYGYGYGHGNGYYMEEKKARVTGWKKISNLFKS